MKHRLYYSIALSFLSMFASALLSNYFEVNIPAYFLGMSIWFFAVGVGYKEKDVKCNKLLNSLKIYILVIAFCMNTAFAVTVPFFYEDVQSGALVYVDYWTCLLYGLMFSGAGIVITTIVLLVRNIKEALINTSRPT